MVKMTINQDAIDFLKKRGYNKHEILLIVDGGGGDYSIEGGSFINLARYNETRSTLLSKN